MKHFVSMEDFLADDIQSILSLAKEHEEHKIPMQNKEIFAANLFYEPSTRTKSSFEVAQRKLGLNIIPFEVIHSSVQKGETLYDTVKTFEAIGCNLLVIRHPETDYYKDLIPYLNIPLINGGDGSGQHPSQCLLDLYTIQKEFGSFKGVKVLIAGDLKHSRVARSNARALAMLGAKVFFYSPAEWVDEELLQWGSFRHIDDVLSIVDVVMMLRVQLERHTEKGKIEDYHSQYGLTIERAKRMKPGSIIMHPAPVNRGVEIAGALVESSQSRIFEQMRNGVYVRMAMIDSLLQKWGIGTNENTAKERTMVGW
ncbi:aspartate carbamoyltransferase catalytic subunit [Bacillus litorisediminis]|uniref:aspartate carbamoyltransferase catalytic subunit n=1 Tax=Bacillus litorisediminis TaxID=2922713 RepID=UPI001FAF9D38|nr:aspartate carbamoyltransferase catalytic subunit [Bacillus litorisediminis]